MSTPFVSDSPTASGTAVEASLEPRLRNRSGQVLPSLRPRRRRCDGVPDPRAARGPRRREPVRLGAPSSVRCSACSCCTRTRPSPPTRLIDELWGDTPPATAESSCRATCPRCGSSSARTVVHTQAPGYLLDVEAGALDLAEFERLDRGGASGPTRTASSSGGGRSRSGATRRSPTSAPSRSPPPRSASSSSSGSARSRTDRRGSRARASRRARPRARRTGRRASVPRAAARAADARALPIGAAGRRARGVPGRPARAERELGLEPGQELRELEAAILRQDESLAVAGRRCPRARRASAPLAPPSGPAAARALVPRRCGRRAWRRSLVGVARGGGASAPPRRRRAGRRVRRTRSRSSTRRRPRRGRRSCAGSVPGPLAVGRRIGLGRQPRRPDADPDRPRLETVVKTIPLPATPTAIAVGAGAVWVAHGQTGQLSRVDPQFADVTTDALGARRSRSRSGGVDVGAGSVWVAFGDATLARVDPGTGGDRPALDAGARRLRSSSTAARSGSRTPAARRSSASIPRRSSSGPLADDHGRPQPGGTRGRDGAVWVASTGTTTR